MTAPLRSGQVIVLLTCLKKATLFSDGQFVRTRLQHIVQNICPEKETLFNTVNLSHATMTLN
jgi:hypothetical protein